MRRWAIGLVLLAIAGGGAFLWQYRRAEQEKQQRLRVVALSDTLTKMRKAIDAFYQDRGRYPHTLDELVPTYLRRIPSDPLTGAADWRLTTEETVAPSQDFTAATTQKSKSVIINVHSTAPGYADY